MGFNYLLIFPPYYVALCASKAQHRLSSESVSWCLETSLFLRLPYWDGALSLPLLSLFFCLLYFSYLLSKTMGCFSGCLMSSAGIQKLFCGFYSAFKCSFDEFVFRHLRTASISQLSYSFICRWTSRWLPCPGYYKQCGDEHWCSHVSFNSGFLGVYA